MKKEDIVFYEASLGSIAPIATATSPDVMKPRYPKLTLDTYMKDDFKDDLSKFEFNKMMENTFFDLDFETLKESFEDDDDYEEDAKKNKIGVGKMKTLVSKLRGANQYPKPRIGDRVGMRRFRKIIRTVLWIAVSVGIYSIPGVSPLFILGKLVGILFVVKIRNQNERDIAEDNLLFVKGQIEQLDSYIENAEDSRQKSRAIKARRTFIKAYRDILKKLDRKESKSGPKIHNKLQNWADDREERDSF